VDRTRHGINRRLGPTAFWLASPGWMIKAPWVGRSPGLPALVMVKVGREGRYAVLRRPWR